MGSKLDLAGLAEFIPEALRNIQDLIKDAVFKHKDMTQHMTIVDGIEHDKHIGFIGELSDIGKKGHAGDCQLNVVTAEATTTQKTWEPKIFDTRLELCRDDIARQIGLMGLEKGINSYDMAKNNSLYFQLFEELLVKSIVKMYNRFAWMADSDAAKFSDSPPGHISNARDLGFINVIDGAWKQIFGILSTTPAQRVTISENAQSTAAAQYNISKADALGYIEKLIYDAPLEMRQSMDEEGGYEILVTQYLYDMLAKNFKDTSLESQRDDLIKGMKSVALDGIPIRPMPTKDVMIRKWHNDGTKYYRPNRAILYKKTNLMLGVPDIRTWGKYRIWFNEEELKVKIDMEDKLDVKILHDNLVMAAY